MSVQEITFDEKELPSGQKNMLASETTHNKYLIKDPIHSASATDMHSLVEQKDSEEQSEHATVVQ